MRGFCPSLRDVSLASSLLSNLREGASPILPMPGDGSNLSLDQPIIVWNRRTSCKLRPPDLHSNMRGPVMRRMDADYDPVRSLYNGLIDKSPVIIARCTDVADVVTAVNFAFWQDRFPISCFRDQCAHHPPSILSTNSQRGILMSANQVICGTSANIGL
jgi:hypothetical protein